MKKPKTKDVIAAHVLAATAIMEKGMNGYRKELAANLHVIQPVEKEAQKKSCKN